MGTDIHMRAEVRKDGRWTAVGAVFKSDYDYPGAPEKTVSPYEHRSYSLFAILADVRNGFGFAGIVTGDGFNPILGRGVRRGLPDDMDPDSLKDETHEYGDEFWFGDHSFTWMTLAELDAFDWGQTTLRCGWVNGPQRAEQLREQAACPPSCCGAVSGGGIEHVHLAELDRRIASGEDTDKVYAEVVWETTYRDDINPFWWEHTMPALRALGAPEDVRIIMGFDS